MDLSLALNVAVYSFKFPDPCPDWLTAEELRFLAATYVEFVTKG